MKYDKLYENWQRFNEEDGIEKEEAAWYANIEDTLSKMVTGKEFDEDYYEDIITQLQEPKFIEGMILKLSNEGIQNLKTVLEHEIKSYKEEGFDSGGLEDSLSALNDRLAINEVNNVKYNKLYENWRRHLEEELEEEVETIVSEDSEGDTAIVNLLSQISQKLDGLEDIDTSIDYLIGAVSGETALSAKMKQSTLGRFADAAPQLAELIKKRQK